MKRNKDITVEGSCLHGEAHQPASSKSQFCFRRQPFGGGLFLNNGSAGPRKTRTQVAGSNVIHLQAVDFFNNNISQGGEEFVARWTPREDVSGETIAASTSTTATVISDVSNNYSAPAEEGDFWQNEAGDDDTATIAAGFSFQTSFSSDPDTSTTFAGDSSAPIVGGDTGAYVTDIGGGRYDVTTFAAAGSYWLEIGVVEPGGLWGTYYQDGGVEAEGG